MRRYRIRFQRHGEYIVRELRREDLIDLLPALQSEQRSVRVVAEEAVVQRCVEGVHTDTLPAGVVSRLASQIFRLSGVEDVESLQKKAREWAESVDGRLEILAMSYLGYRLHEIWQLPLSEWQYVMVAAVYAASMHGVDVARFVNREQYEDMRKAATLERMRANSNVAQPVSYQTPTIEKEYEFTWFKGR